MGRRLLSICIPTYNRAEIVYECVKACLEIESDEVEVIVNDNCSTDNTRELLATIKDERFFYYRNDENIGYRNFTVAMSKGNAKYALLLSDEDEVFNVDWERTLEQLKYDTDVAVYQCEYYDETGGKLVSGPEVTFAKDTGRVYCYVLRNCLFGGAIIVKREIIEKVWNQIDWESFLCLIYPQCVLAVYCVREGSFQKLEGFSVRRTNRNNTGTLDVGSWKGAASEPYWSMSSREIQNEEWIKLFFSMGLNEEKLNRIAMEILIKNAREIVNYHYVIRSGKWEENIIFKKRPDIVERDCMMSEKDWKSLFFESSCYLKRKENLYFKKNNMKYRTDDVYKSRMRKEYSILMTHMSGEKDK